MTKPALGIKRFHKIIEIVRSRLLYSYLLILFIAVMMLLIAFGATEYMMNQSVMNQSMQSVEVIFEQAQERLQIIQDDMNNLHMNVVNNTSVVEFFQATQWSDRWENLAEFNHVVANNKRINQNLENILLYDTRDELIAASGKVFIAKPEGMSQDGNVTFSGCLYEEGNEVPFFEVGMAAYAEISNNEFVKIGSVCLLFNNKDLQDIVESALPNEESAVAILDANNGILAKTDLWIEQYSTYQESMEDQGLVIRCLQIGETGWRLVGVIPRESMLSEVSKMQMINYISYLVLIILMCIIMLFIYFSIVRPITRQTVFMSEIAKDPRQRIPVSGNNEISKMENKMNEMLDDIEMLNQQVIESQRQYLELEYAKRQTEMIAYQSQINPHFLHNTFNCIRGMALYKGEKDIADLTMALSSFFRYSVHGEQLVTVQEVLESLEYYAQIIDFRFAGKHKVLIEADDDVRAVRIPKMLIQPLAENAVLHGLEPRIRGDVQIKISIDYDEQENAMLKIVIEDEGQGIPCDIQEQLKKCMKSYDETGTLTDSGIGIGVMNVYRRMRLFYGNQAFFELNSVQDKGTKINLLLPII